MPTWTIHTNEYDVDLHRLLVRRLPKVRLEKQGEAVRVCASGKAETEHTVLGLALLVGRDLRCFELARIIDELPFNITEKQRILTRALESSRDIIAPAALCPELSRCLEDSSSFCPEGFIRFRMRDALLIWELCCEQAAAELLLEKDYNELARTLRDYVQSRPPKMQELRLCIHPEGRCTLTDDASDSGKDPLNIEYVDGSLYGIVRLIVGMAPKRLIVYDLSGGGQSKLAKTLELVFDKRVKVYR